MRQASNILLALAVALPAAGCLGADAPDLPLGPPSRVVADGLRVPNGTHVMVPLEGNASGDWAVQVRVLQGSPIVFWLATPEEAEAFGETPPRTRLGPNIEGRLSGSFPEGRAVLILDNTGAGPPSHETGGGVFVSYRALLWEAGTPSRGAPGL